MKMFVFIVKATYSNCVKKRYYSLSDLTETLEEARESIIENMNSVFESWEGLKLKRIEDENGKLLAKF